MVRTGGPSRDSVFGTFLPGWAADGKMLYKHYVSIGNADTVLSRVRALFELECCVFVHLCIISWYSGIMTT